MCGEQEIKTIYKKQLHVKDLALKLTNPHLTLQVGLIAQLVSRALHQYSQLPTMLSELCSMI